MAGHRCRIRAASLPGPDVDERRDVDDPELDAHRSVDRPQPDPGDEILVPRPGNRSRREHRLLCDDLVGPLARLSADDIAADIRRKLGKPVEQLVLGRERAVCVVEHGVATVTFSGRSFAWVSTFGSTRGSAKIIIDGVWIATVDTHRSSTTYRAVAWAGTW